MKISLKLTLKSEVGIIVCVKLVFEQLSIVRNICEKTVSEYPLPPPACMKLKSISLTYNQPPPPGTQRLVAITETPGTKHQESVSP